MTAVKQITLLEGDAVDLLETLEDSYDLIFYGLAKSASSAPGPQAPQSWWSGPHRAICLRLSGDVAKPFGGNFKCGYLPRFAAYLTQLLDSPDFMTASCFLLGDGLL